MDTLYKLPFPQEVCSKIFIFACKTPHNGLGGAILKNKLQIMNLDIPDKDDDVIIFDSYNIINYPRYVPIKLYLFSCFHNLTDITLFNTSVNGNISYLSFLHNLKKIWLTNTGVYGDIMTLKSLHNLKVINLQNTGVYGDIIHLKYLLNIYLH